MGEKKIPSLGDSTPVKLIRMRESFPLPKGRKEVVAAVERILNLGGVQKITVELGSPIRVTRAVEPGSELPEEMQDDDLMAAIRNTAMEEFVFADPLLPTNYLFRAFHFLSQRRLQPVAVVVNNLPTLKLWLGVEKSFDLVELFGVQIHTHKEMPDDGLLLTAAQPDDLDTVTFSLKLAMDSKEKK